MAPEALEARIAPATLTGGKLTYTDTDNDLVTITFSKKTGLDAADFVFDTAFDATGPQKLLSIDLSDDSDLTGTNITMKVTKVGDGTTNVGAILASGIKLGKVTIQGDLRQITVGDGAAGAPAIKSLTAKSFGLQGANLATIVGGPLPSELNSLINGPFGKITINGDFAHANLQSFASATAKSGSLTILGKLLGGDASGEGMITLGSVGTIKLGGIEGATLANPSDPLAFSAIGGILSVTTVGKLAITGDIQGGNFTRSGSVQISGSAGTITIGGKIIGGHGGQAGSLSVNGDIASLTVGGLVGGNLDGPGDFVVGGRSGAISTFGKVGKLKVLDGITGGSIALSGSIFIGGDVKSAQLTGNLVGAAGEDSGQLSVDGALGTLKVTGSLLGGTGNGSGVISAPQIGKATVVGDLVGTDLIPAGPGSSFGLTGGIESGRVQSLKITGSVFGGDGREEAGGVSVNEIKTFHLTGSVEGGAMEGSGTLDLDQVSGTVTILGGIKGGAGEESGSVRSSGAKSVKVNGVIEGGSGSFAGSLLLSGNTGAVTVGGLKAGTGILTGSVANQSGNIKSVLVKGDILGSAANAAHIAVGGGFPGLSLGSVTVTGKVESGRITAGITADFAISADGTIGTVSIGGDFIASVIAAGVDPQGDFFADGNDTLIANSDDPAITSRIASVVIKGSVLGTANPTDDSFGIIAQEVAKVTVRGKAVALTPLAGNDTSGVALDGTTDVRVREI